VTQWQDHPRDPRQSPAGKAASVVGLLEEGVASSYLFRCTWRGGESLGRASTEQLIQWCNCFLRVVTSDIFRERSRLHLCIQDSGYDSSSDWVSQWFVRVGEPTWIVSRTFSTCCRQPSIGEWVVRHGETHGSIGVQGRRARCKHNYASRASSIPHDTLQFVTCVW
jgi:hypothetical protein